jgi:cytolysin (calcineurin-like family phosphatase)
MCRETLSQIVGKTDVSLIREFDALKQIYVSHWPSPVFALRATTGSLRRFVEIQQWLASRSREAA